MGLTACGGETVSSPTGTEADRTSDESSGEPATGGVRPDGGSNEDPQPDRDSEEGTSEEPSDSSARPNREFLRPDGDNSVQTFGAEAGPDEREAASIVLERYLEARAVKDEGAMCRDLSGAPLEALESYAEASPPLKGKSCPEILAILNQVALPKPSTMTGPIASFRVQGDRGFALYRGSDGDYFMQMVKEEGAWKVGALAPVEIP
jgi:hypothetical protein